MINLLRQEKTFSLYQYEAIYYINQFKQLLIKDDFSKNGVYTVRSLYFDTVTDSDFFDTVNEQNSQHSLRLSIYNPIDQTAKLEFKKMEGFFKKTSSLIISKKDALGLINGDYCVLLNYKDRQADEIYSLMARGVYKPKIMIEYQRQAFMIKENNTRLTFDTNIRATESCFDLFSENLLLYPVTESNSVVFKVKYNRFLLSYISDVISVIDKRPVTSNKYVIGRSLSYPGYA